jgi:diguanylate cyclase (GGDEF)-like protein/PAS domain S-box-containing protein
MLQELSADTYRAVLESLPTGVYLVDPDCRVLLWSAGAADLTGYLSQEVIGRPCRQDLLIPCTGDSQSACSPESLVHQTMRDGQPRTADLFLLHKDGSRLPVSFRTVPLRDGHGSISGAVVCFDQRVVLPIADPVARRLSLVTAIDPVSGLPDQHATAVRLKAYLGAFEASPVPFGVLCIAVDEMEHLCELHGRKAVEAVLHATGQTLSASVSPNDLVGRWTGDRFLAVITGCTESTLDDVANRLKRVVQLESVPWWGDRLCITLSMGAAIVRPGDTAESLLGRAETALNGILEESEA